MNVSGTIGMANTNLETLSGRLRAMLERARGAVPAELKAMDGQRGPPSLRDQLREQTEMIDDIAASMTQLEEHF